MLDVNNQPVMIDSLSAISPGNDTMAGSSHLLYFTAGPDEETHGLFGVLTPVPEPSAYAMMLAGGTWRLNAADHAPHPGMKFL